MQVKSTSLRLIVCAQVSLFLAALLLVPATAFGAAKSARDTFAPKGGPLSIFVSVLPQKFLVERIGQQHVSVTAMAGAGHNPTTYEPTSKQIARLHNSDAYLCVGVPFETTWIRSVINSGQALKVIDIRDKKKITTSDRIETQHADDHTHHNTLDPHVWTSPAQIKVVARHIRDILSELDPEHTATFSGNLKLLENELDDLDRFIRQRLAKKRVTRFMVFHPAWGHFAKQYGLTQIAIEQNGKEPGAKALAQLIAQARQHNITSLFVQAQFSRRSTSIIATAINGKIIVVDPLAENILDNINRFVELLTNG